MSASYQVLQDRAAWSESGEGLVVLDLQDSNYLSLNGSATTLWRRMAAGPATAEELEQALRAEYDIDEQPARDDVAVFVAELIQRGLVAQRETP